MENIKQEGNKSIEGELGLEKSHTSITFLESRENFLVKLNKLVAKFIISE